MRSRLVLGAIVVAAIALGAAAIACATEGAAEPEEVPPVHDAAIDAIDATPLDAEAGRTDAGPCAASGLCTVPVPIDQRINVASVSGSGANDVWAVGTDRTILHYDGSVWEKAKAIEYDAAAFTMRAVWAGGPNDVWVSDGPMLRHTTGWKGPDATEWTSSTLVGTSTASPSAIRGKDGRVVIARQFWSSYADAVLVVCEGWDDAGVREPVYVSGPFAGQGTNGIWSLALTRADEAWATSVGTERDPGARIVRAYLEAPDAGGTDGGVKPSWKFEEHDSRTPKNLYGVWGDETVVWLVGEGGIVRRMTRERVSSRVFEIVPSPGIADLRGIYGFSGDDIWAVGDDATVLHWDGSLWTKLATPFDATGAKPKLFAVWGSGPNDVWIGGNGVMLHFAGKTP